MRCCTDLVKFLLFIANLLAFIAFLALDGGVLYILFNGENTFLGRDIEYSLQESNPSAIYFTIIIILLVLFSFFSLFTCLGCCGAACKSSCMIGSFIVIEFVLFGGSVGGLVFLHYKYGLDAVQEILDQELSRSVSSYSQNSVLIKGAWDWFLVTAQCCGVGVEGIKVWTRADLQPNYRVPQACCKPNYDECMYEPGFETTNLSDCIPVLLPFAQAFIYGLPVLMLVSLVFAFIVTSTFNRRETRKEERPYHSTSQYSIGAENEFDTTYHTEGNPTAPYDNSPYNPQYELNAYRNVGDYPTGTVSPPDNTYPLLHAAPPSYNEVVKYSADVGPGYSSEIRQYSRQSSYINQ